MILKIRRLIWVGRTIEILLQSCGSRFQFIQCNPNFGRPFSQPPSTHIWPQRRRSRSRLFSSLLSFLSLLYTRLNRLSTLLSAAEEDQKGCCSRRPFQLWRARCWSSLPPPLLLFFSHFLQLNHTNTRKSHTSQSLSYPIQTHNTHFFFQHTTTIFAHPETGFCSSRRETSL